MVSLVYNFIYLLLSHDIVSGSDITQCIKNCTPPVVYRFWKCYVMAVIITSHIYGII